jgi:hypothetical protein
VTAKDESVPKGRLKFPFGVRSAVPSGLFLPLTQPGVETPGYFHDVPSGRRTLNFRPATTYKSVSRATSSVQTNHVAGDGSDIALIYYAVAVEIRIARFA